MWTIPLTVAIPLLAAAILSATGKLLPRRLTDVLACVSSAFVCGACCWLCYASAREPLVYWFGGWSPGGWHYPLGISFVVDPIGAGLAALVSLLMLAALVFAWRYFESVHGLFHALMMVFLAGMTGLCLTGDLFNLFVWFELMTASGVALCGYKSEEYGPLQGALNFAVVNTVGAFLSLTGVALLYAHTGTLNMAQVAVSLNEAPPANILVQVAFILVITGFLAKAAVFPFHFWLADAHAVAPTPVCVLFSGVMVELGIYAVARLHYTVFAEALAPQAGTLRVLFLTAGTLTAIVGAIECFGQKHLKRLLAFSTISHVGVMLIAFSLMSSKAISGLAGYVVGHGLVKGALFVAAGILLQRFETVDERELRGVGRRLRITAPAFLLAAIGLAGFPPFPTFFSEHWIEESARAQGAHWIEWTVSTVTFLAAAVTTAAVLRIGARIFLGWGEYDQRSEAPKLKMKRETHEQPRRTPVIMWLPAWVLVLLAIAGGVVLMVHNWHASARLDLFAEQFMDGGRYAARVLERPELQKREEPTLVTAEEPFPSVARPILTLIAAAVLAGLALYPRKLGNVGRLLEYVGTEMVRPLRHLQSGRVGDYVAWLVVGVAAYGLAIAFG